MPATSSGPERPAGSTRETGKRVVLVTFGSFGDLHPYIAIALGLRARGHEPIIATSGLHRAKVESEGIRFQAVRPDFGPPENNRKLMRQGMDRKRGSEFVIRQMLMPHVRDMYEDLLPLARSADLLVSHPISYAAPVVGEKLGMRWVATTLAPMTYVSAYDPPIPPTGPVFLRHLRLGPALMRPITAFGKRTYRHWATPVDALRAEVGLPRGENPIFDGQYSPHLNLALFSRVLGEPQPDWPQPNRVTGFPFYDRLQHGQGLPPELERFLEAGPPPIVFTLGSSAVHVAEGFYLESAEAARRLGRRAVLLVGPEGWNRLPEPLPEGVFATAYAPHSELFPRAAAIVHQGGIGTTGQALRSGRPALVVPFSHDQPDNAFRVTRLGTARTLERDRYRAPAVAPELRALLEDSRYADRAAEIGQRFRSEDGVGAACDALEELLAADR
jgi:rhamnosyltransferase subunit B